MTSGTVGAGPAEAVRPDNRIPTISILPGNVPPEEHFARMRQAMEPFIDATVLRDVNQMRHQPSMRLHHLGRLMFSENRLVHQRSRRDAGWIRRNDVGHVLVQAFVQGGGVSLHGGREYRTGTDAIVAANMGYELDAILDDSIILMLVVPPELIAEHLPELRDVRGPLFAPGGTASRIFADFLVSLQQNLPAATLAEAPALTDAAIGLLSALLSKEDTASAGARRGVLMAVQRHIEQRLGDLDLGVDSLCSHFRLSRASLYRLFEELGGVRAYIQRRRLMACFRALCEPRNHHRPVFDVALDYGFFNASQLSALFRRHFGMSPREVKEAAGDQFQPNGISWLRPEGDGLSAPELMRLWSRQLGGS